MAELTEDQKFLRYVRLRAAAEDTSPPLRDMLARLLKMLEEERARKNIWLHEAILAKRFAGEVTDERFNSEFLPLARRELYGGR